MANEGRTLSTTIRKRNTALSHIMRRETLENILIIRSVKGRRDEGILNKKTKKKVASWF